MQTSYFLYLMIYLQLEAYVDVDEKFTNLVLFLFVFRDYRVHKNQDSLISPSESLDRFRGLVNLALVFLVSENCTDLHHVCGKETTFGR